MKSSERRDIEEFRDLVREVLGSVSKTLEDQEGFRYVSRGGRGLLFPASVGSSYLRAKQLLMSKAQAARRLLSDEEIDNRLVEFFVDLAYQDQRKTKRELDRHISILFREVKLLPRTRYLCLVPVEHIIAKVPLDIGGSQLVSMSAAAFRAIESEHEIDWRFLGNTLEERARKLVDVNETQNFIKVQVEASDWTKAEELALQMADRFLDILRLYVGECPCVVRGEALKAVKRGLAIGMMDGGGVAEHFGWVNQVVNPLVVDEHLCDELQRVGLHNADALLRTGPEELSEVERRLIEAIFWHGKATKDTASIDKVVKLVAALESLFVSGQRNKKEIIGRRFVAVAYPNEDRQRVEELFEKMVSLVEIRNRILHGGLTYVETEDRRQLEYWTRASIQTMLGSARQGDLRTVFRDAFPEDKHLRIRLGIQGRLRNRIKIRR